MPSALARARRTSGAGVARLLNPATGQVKRHHKDGRPIMLIEIDPDMGQAGTNR